MAKEHVLLLHGLWMRSFAFVALRRRLERAGYSVECFDYPSVLGAWQAAIAGLHVRLSRHCGRKVHLVGHSLGGFLALQAARSAPRPTGGRIVCLGSPLRGSAAASAAARWPGGSLLVGKNREFLARGMDRWCGNEDVGCVAGCVPMGFGSAFGGLAKPHDGTVSVAETRLPGVADHCVVAATHTGLLFSAEAANQAIAFLRHGRFVRDAASC